jgi:hypothetical protein
MNMKLDTLCKLLLVGIMAVVTCRAWRSYSHEDVLRALVTARIPLVLVSGQATQLAAADYLTVAGGVTTNATPPTGAADIETTTETVSSFATFDNAALAATPTAAVTVQSQLWGKPQLTIQSPDGLAQYVQQTFGHVNIHAFTVLPGTTTLSGYGLGGIVATGTPTTRAFATTNICTSAVRIGYVSAASAGSVAGARDASGYMWLGNATGTGGFTAWYRFCVSDAALVATGRTFVGLEASLVAPTDVDPDTLTSIVGICQDNGDTNWQLCAAGAVAQPRTSLGASFPINETDLVEFTIYSAPHSGTIQYALRQIGTGVSGGVQTTTGTITAAAQLISNTTFVGPQNWRSNGGTASAVAIDVVNFATETPF